MQTRLLILLCFLVNTVGAQVSHVVPPGTLDNNPDPTAFFNTWTNAATNIQDAVNAAVAADWTNVWVSNGTYYLTNQIVVTNAITLRSWTNGALDRTNTIIDGNYPLVTNRCVYINHTDAVVRGFTMRNGRIDATTAYGGGVYIVAGLLDYCIVAENYAGATNIGAYGGGISMGGSSIVSNCIVRQNRTHPSGPSGHFGGGVYASGSSLIVESQILSNTGRLAGGFYLVGNAVMRNCLVARNVMGYSTSYGGGGGRLRDNARLEDCEIRENFSPMRGGGIHLSDNGVIRNCRIIANKANEASYGGGGVYINLGSGAPRLENSYILHNTNETGYAGGVTVHWSSSHPVTPTILNCLIAFNVGHQAGGIYLYDAVGEIINCTIVGNNSSGEYGTTGGIRFRKTSMNVYNTIIYHNTGYTGYAPWQNWRVSDTPPVPVINNSCSTPTVDAYGDNNRTDDPQFISLAPESYNFRLPPDSPCVNTGTNQPAWMNNAFDLDGRARIDRFSGRVDMGCYEYISQGTLYHVR